MAVIVCPICSTRYRVTEAQLAKASRLKCKKCKTVFPVSDNIKSEASLEETESPAPPSPTPEKLPFSGDLNLPSSQESPRTSEGDKAPASGADDMTLDFNFSSASSAGNAASSMDFSFSAEMPKETPEDDGEESVELQDHIADSLHSDQGQLNVGLGGPSLNGEFDRGETTLSMDGGGSLDFSFSAVMPETPPEDDEEDVLGDGGGTEEGGMQDLSLGLDLGAPPDDATMTMSDTSSSMNLNISLDEIPEEGGVTGGIGGEADSEYESGAMEGYATQEPLDTCCVDSLAMGMPTCELCGRDLQGLEDHEFVKQRREQLREELPEGESQIGFSREGTKEKRQAPIVPSEDDDFSDVEKALDALADGSFEKEIKKRAAKKHRGKRLKIMGVGVVLGLIAVIVAGTMLLPSSQERLTNEYQELMAQPEVEPRALVSLFLDAVAKQNQDIFQKVSVMSTMPDITGGSVLTLGEDYEPTSLGQLGKEVADLEAELASLKARYESTEKQWQEASSVDLSPNLINGNIGQLLKKQATLQAEMDQKAQESAERMLGLEADIQEAEDELEVNRQRADQYLDATDKQGKAMYTASVRNQQSLSDKIGKLEALLADERLSHAKRLEDLHAEYDPQFEKLTDDLEVQRALYEKAILYIDEEHSPLVVLDKELKETKSAINETERVLQEKQQQLSAVFDFFKRPERRKQVEQYRNEAEFSHISKNVVTSVKFRGAGKEKVPIVLKRYQAIVGEQTIQGDWVVEAVLR